jgi:hypothetical protein
MKIISDLNNSEFEINENNCYLSLNDDRLLTIACEFICCFGIHYNLEDNIGIPIEKLSRFGLIVKQKRENVDPVERNKRLNECLKQLFDIKLRKRQHVDVTSIFYVKHLHSILCALVQLTYSPNRCSNENSDIYFKWLEEDLFNEIDGAILVRNLMMTQGIEKFMKVPTWFINATSDLLTKSVLRPNSVVNTIKAILEEIDVNKTTESANDWKKCDLIARILTKCPRKLTIEAYIQFIAPQVIKLFQSIDETKPTKNLIRVSGSIYSILAQKHPQLTRNYLTKQLILPFNFDHGITKTIDADDLLKTLKLLHMVYCTSTDPNWQTIKQLDEQLLHLIFQIQIVSSTKTTCKVTNKLCLDLLKNYLNYIEDKESQLSLLFRLLECSIIGTQNDCPYCLSTKFSINFENLVSCDRISLKLNEENDEEKIVPTLEHVEERCNSIIKLIQLLNDETIQIDYLFQLFTKLNSYISQQINNNPKLLETKSKETDSTFLQLENKISNIETQFNVKILYLTQISLYLENLDADLLIKNYLKLVSLCKLILENIINLIGLNEDNVVITEQIIKNEQEICGIILNILSLFTSEFIECSYEVKQELYTLLPSIQKIKEIYSNNGDLFSLAEMLCISVGTYGVVKTEKIKAQSKLIEEIPIFKPNSFEQVLYELNDPLLPVRGHALILLRQLIERNDQECIKDATKTYEIIINGLQSSDSYIYLAAINCLIAYAIRISSSGDSSNNIIKRLLDEYLKNSFKLNENDRLKMGEVIMKLIRNLNELVPFYGEKLISVFLVSCKSDDEFIRISSLSNLGETCKLLNYKIVENLNEIVNCVASILETDKSVNVRRSAILVVKLLFEGLNKESFMNIIGDSLLGLYRTLKKILNDYRQDDVIQIQALLAYEYLDELMKAYLFPKESFVKEIKILNP